MSPIRTIVEHRRVEVPAPPELPDGTEVFVQLTATANQTGLTEETWSNTPDAVEAWVAWLESLEPLTFTDQELATLAREQERQREWELLQFNDRGDRLMRQWK